MALPMRVQQGQVYDPFELAQREFDGLLGRLITARGGENGSPLAPYGVDVREDQDHIYVEAELPGFKKEEVDITLENSLLTITAQRTEEKSSGNGGNSGAQAVKPKGDYLLKERRFTRFARSFSLPPTVDEQSVNARLEHGVLTVVLNKREETKPRKITVG